MKKILLIVFCALMFTGLGVNAQTDLSGKIPVASNVKTGTLPNGLKYYIRYNAKPEKKVELRLAVNAGSILEDDDQQGLGMMEIKIGIGRHVFILLETFHED